MDKGLTTEQLEWVNAILHEKTSLDTKDPNYNATEVATYLDCMEMLHHAKKFNNNNLTNTWAKWK